MQETDIMFLIIKLLCIFLISEGFLLVFSDIYWTYALYSDFLSFTSSGFWWGFFLYGLYTLGVFHLIIGLLDMSYLAKHPEEISRTKPGRLRAKLHRDIKTVRGVTVGFSILIGLLLICLIYFSPTLLDLLADGLDKQKTIIMFNKADNVKSLCSNCNMTLNETQNQTDSGSGCCVAQILATLPGWNYILWVLVGGFFVCQIIVTASMMNERNHSSQIHKEQEKSCCCFGNSSTSRSKKSSSDTPAGNSLIQDIDNQQNLDEVV